MSTKVNQKTKTFSVRVPLHLANFIQKQADLEVRSESNFLISLIEKERRKVEFKNLPIMKLSPEKTEEIEKMIDDYNGGKLQTTPISGAKELNAFLEALNEEAEEE